MDETRKQAPIPDRKIPHILIPLPDHDFDPTESSYPWKECQDRGWKVSFSTEHGAVAAADHRLLKGPLRGPLGATRHGRESYYQMAQDQAYKHPIPYAEINPDDYDAIHLTGGHAPGMRQFLESTDLQGKVLQFWQQSKVIGAICHGVIILARTIDPKNGLSVLHGSKVTTLTKNLERSGYLLTFWLLGRRYRTYECYVADEVQECLASPGDFQNGKSMLAPFVLEDGRLITSRWPLDAGKYAAQFADLVAKSGAD